MNREVKYGKSFICKGGKEKCDRRCEIAMIELEGKNIPLAVPVTGTTICDTISNTTFKIWIWSAAGKSSFLKNMAQQPWR